METGYKLYLDDIRIPTDSVKNANRFGLDPRVYQSDDWVIVRNFEQFTFIIMEKFKSGEWPYLISFDHDLGQEHTKFFFENGGWDSPPDPLTGEFVEMTGYDAAKWLCDFIMEHNISVPGFLVHSANPVGRKNIESYLSNFTNYYERKTGRR